MKSKTFNGNKISYTKDISYGNMRVVGKDNKTYVIAGEDIQTMLKCFNYDIDTSKRYKYNRLKLKR